MQHCHTIIAKQTRELSKQSQQIDSLKHELSQLKRMIFGQKSERFERPPEEQQALDLFPEQHARVGIQVVRETISYERRKQVKGHGRNSFPEHIYSEVHIIEPDDSEKVCSCCGKEKKCMGKDITRELDYKPAVFFGRKFIRPKYVCSSCPDQGVTIGLLPARPIERGIAGPGLLTYILISKHVDHLPLYRLEEIFKRYDIHINRSSMVGWIGKVCEYLEHVYHAMKKQLITRTYLQSDETPLKVQDPAKKKKCHLGYLWPYTDGEQIVFQYCKSRNRDGPNIFLEKFQGYLQTDGYAGYNDVVSRNGLMHAMCWAHARREFIEAEDSDPEFVRRVLVPIAKMYAVEKYCREEKLTEEKRHKVRQIDVPDLLEELKMVLQNPSRSILPKSILGNARSYVVSNWQALTRYLEDGRLEIDNNRIENAIRPIALGRKNWLFAGSHEGAKRLAIIYSLVGTCKMNNINPFDYLKEVLSCIADYPMSKITELTPLEWKKSKEKDMG